MTPIVGYKLAGMTAIGEEYPDSTFAIGVDFIMAVNNLKQAALLLIQTEGAYDLEHLEDAVNELDDA